MQLKAQELSAKVAEDWSGALELGSSAYTESPLILLAHAEVRINLTIPIIPTWLRLHKSTPCAQDQEMVEHMAPELAVTLACLGFESGVSGFGKGLSV